jgi:hypothetical protein
VAGCDPERGADPVCLCEGGPFPARREFAPGPVLRGVSSLVAPKDEYAPNEEYAPYPEESPSSLYELIDENAPDEPVASAFPVRLVGFFAVAEGAICASSTGPSKSTEGVHATRMRFGGFVFAKVLEDREETSSCADGIVDSSWWEKQREAQSCVEKPNCQNVRR